MPTSASPRFFGLAVLSLLYFAQAREIKRLREWAGRAPERAPELEQRVVAQADAARQAPAPIAARPPGGDARRAPAAAHGRPSAAVAAAPQATVEADVLEGEEAAASTNGHHDGPVPPPAGLVGTPAEGTPEEEAEAGAAEGAANGAVADGTEDAPADADAAAEEPGDEAGAPPRGGRGAGA